jgi:hypothetical protein
VLQECPEQSLAALPRVGAPRKGKGRRKTFCLLVTQTESDPVAVYAGRLYGALTGSKTFIRFSAAEGAGDHCEVSARSLYFQCAYDWLDGVFGR